jgi:phosphonate transport system substrate-binding protein
VDGAAVDNLVFEYLSRTHPEFTSKTKVIEKSPPYGIPPVVVPPSLDPKLKNSLREILLNVHRDEEGKEILKGMMIDKFVTVDDSAYDSIREMNRWVAEKNSEEPKTE